MLRIRVTTPKGDTLFAKPTDAIRVLGDLYFDLVSKQDITVRFDGDGSIWRYQMESAR